jgi:glycosyltransferase involved in cell wall biosynthesis
MFLKIYNFFFLYSKLRRGQLSQVEQARFIFLYEFNPLAIYAKAAAYGVLGNIEQATLYVKLLNRRFPFNPLKQKLAKYMGRTQISLVRELLGIVSRDNTLRIAFELVVGSRLDMLPKPSFTKPNLLLQSLWENRSAQCAIDRVASINNLLLATGGETVLWNPDGVVKIKHQPIKVHQVVKEKHEPLVTVLVTSFNAGLLVRQSLESLQIQSHRNLQILVANDASTDDTWEHISSLVEQDSRITAFNLPENIGTYAAKALMFRFAKGEYIVCHDADDLAAPNFIERSLGVLLKNPRKVAVISNWFRVDEELRIFPGAVRRFWPLLSINHSSLMLRTEILKSFGAWDVPRVAADTELFERIRMMYGKRAVVHLPEPLTIGSMRADSLMNDPVLGAMEKEAFRKRVEYREAWGEWHQACKKKRLKPIMSSPLSDDRPFYVPEVFRVDPKAISRCWDSMLSQHSEKLTTD